VGALGQLLLILPGNWAKVAKLRNILLHDASVIVCVLHVARLLEEKIGGEV